RGNFRPCRSRLALLDPNPGNELQPIEVAKLNGTSLARLLAHIVGFDPAGALDNSAQLPTGNFDSLLLSSGGAAFDLTVPQPAFDVRAVDNDELAIQHFASAVLRTSKQSALADIARANMQLQRRDRSVRDRRVAALFGCIAVIKHGRSPSA